MKRIFVGSMSVLVALLLAACDGDSDSGSGITAVTAGTGLSGGGSAGEVTLSADTEYLQRRVDDLCMGNTAVKSIGDDGTVTCSAEMSLATHDHGNTYAAFDHNHDGVYSPIDHQHAGVYALEAHDHDARYFPRSEFTGHSTNNCANDTGYFIIGNMQEEFGCHENCDVICQRHDLTCQYAYSVTGVMRTCTSINNSDMLYCWCKS
jgi:hypothetical protein